MVYIKRDDEGRISSIFIQGNEEAIEQVDVDDPELVDFLARCDKKLRYDFMKSDLQLIRALEDLINILMEKNIINITDFPQPVVDKLLARQAIRKRYVGVSGMEYEEDEKKL